MIDRRTILTGVAKAALLSLAAPAALAATGSEALALTGVRVIDGVGSAPRTGVAVLIRNGLIEAVVDEAAAIPADCRVIRMPGATVLPGWINAHVHQAYSEATLRRWAQAGVTTVRDLSPLGGPVSLDQPQPYLQERDLFRKDVRCAHLLSSNPGITKPGGYGLTPIRTPEEGRETVRRFVGLGVDLIKIAIEDDQAGRTWPMLSAEEVKVLTEEAHTAGKRLSAHVTHARNLAVAIEAGVDDINHMAMDPVDDATLEAVVRRGIVWIPTLELWNGADQAHGLNLLEIATDNLARFRKAGGRIAFGTDFGGYFTPFDQDFPITEARLMLKAGLTPMEVIVSGTSVAAATLGMERWIGAVEPGKWADLLVVRGDPLSSLDALTEPAMVVHRGAVIRGPDA